MHLIAEQRALIGVRVEVETTCLRPEDLFARLKNLMAIRLKGVLAGSDSLDDIEARITTAGVNAYEPAAGAERTFAVVDFLVDKARKAA